MAYAIPADEATWLGDALSRAYDPDAVRAVFDEARTRFALVAEQRAAEPDSDGDAEEHTGIMVAFMLPAAIAQSLHDTFAQAIQDHPRRDAIKPLPVDKMHVTLAYLGDTTADEWSTRKARTLGRVVDDFAADQMPFPIRLGGVARFHNEGRTGHELDAVYVPVESEAIQGFRRALVDTLNARGLAVDTTFPDYKPHVTLAYIPPDMATPTVAVPGGEATVDALTVAIGGEHSAYPLSTEQNGNALEGTGRTAQADSLVDLAVALQRLGILPAADQQAQVIEQVRDLRAQVADALKAS